MDTLLSKYGDKLRVVACNKNAKNLKVLFNNFNSQQCTDKEGFYYFMIPRQPTITICICKKYHTYFISKTLTIQSNLPTVSSTSAEALSSGIKIDFNINIYNNLPKIKLNTIQDPLSTRIICKTKNIPCIILQNEKHSLDLNALTLKNQQLDFPAHLQCFHQLKLKPIQQQIPLSQEQQNTFYLLKFISLNKEQKKQLLLSIYNKAFAKKHTKRKENDQDRLQKNSKH
ncbi:39038_t:CDS:2 [Gigaspora margarita]|uniref:39038_t:CDS:1 n=1 Tax=Gigaspora margarita TaxID=4874 RepID=A0ABM8VY52_GIGMA|nr:39038_t:CDS:2 [Gigaspora margarita]